MKERINVSSHIRNWSVIGFIVLIVLILLTYQYRKTNEAFINRDITLQESVAAVLYSSSLPYELIGDGKSYLFLINKDGEANLFHESGLESNSMILTKDRLILNLKKEVLTLDLFNHISRVPMTTCKVYSGYGQSSGYLKNKDIYYSLYNHKFKENEPVYISYIRWGSEDEQYCQEINEYIKTTGHDANKAYLITSDIFKLKDINLVEIEFNGETLIKNKYLLNHQYIGNMSFLTKVISDVNYLYFIYSDRFEGKIHLKLVQVDKLNRQIVNEYKLREYNLEDDPKFFFFNNDSIYLVDGKIYYVDGFGDTYSFDLKTKSNQYLFRFQEYKRKDYHNDEQVFFRDNKLYFFRYDENKELHVIETYKLNGERESIIEIPGIKDQVRKHGVFLYDFKMID